jgi:lipopolysaccharide transport system permease protein
VQRGERPAGCSPDVDATTLEAALSLPYATADDDAAVAGAEAAAPELQPWRQPLGRSLREAWDSRHLLPPLMRQVMPDYAHTYLGRWWLILRPGLGIAAYALLFGGIFGAEAPNGIPYLVFLVLGLQGWRLFQHTVVYETRSFQRLGKFARSLNVPLLLLPTASIARAFVDFAVYGGFGLIALLYYWIAQGTLYLQVGPELLAGVAGWVLCVAFGWAVGLFTATLNARVQDVRYTLPVLLQLWLFCTPVVYPLEQVPERYRPLVEANPMTGVMELIKYGFLDAGQVHAAALAWSLVATVGTAVVGLRFFNRYARVAARTDLDDEEEEELA